MLYLKNLLLSCFKLRIQNITTSHQYTLTFTTYIYIHTPPNSRSEEKILCALNASCFYHVLTVCYVSTLYNAGNVRHWLPAINALTPWRGNDISLELQLDVACVVHARHMSAGFHKLVLRFFCFSFAFCNYSPLSLFFHFISIHHISCCCQCCSNCCGYQFLLNTLLLFRCLFFFRFYFIIIL